MRYIANKFKVMKIPGFLLAGTLMLLFHAQANAQQFSPVEVPYIEVSGVAEREVIPNRLYTTIVLLERYDGRDKIDIATQETKLRKGLIALGIPDTQLYLADVDADFLKVKWNNKDVLTQKSYTLLVHDAGTLAKVFALLDELEIKNAFLSKVDHSAMDSLRREVRIDAIRAAKEKAAYLLQAIDAQLGPPLIVREQEMYYGYQRNVMLMESVTIGMDKREDELPELQFEKIRLENSVFVRFAIATTE